MDTESEEAPQVRPMPWSRNALGRLGKCLVRGDEIPEGTPKYEDVMLWYNDLTGYLHYRIEALGLANYLNAVPEISSRSKTIDTLTEKLIRHPNYQLPNIQDISGARFECDMTLTQQSLISAALVHELSDVAEVEVKDYRTQDHSGYRAVHLWLTFPRLKARAEIQIRTHIQAAWANTYEQAADRFGRHIRYGGYPDDTDAREMVEFLQTMSTDQVTKIEQMEDHIASTLRILNNPNSVKPQRGGLDKRKIRRIKRKLPQARANMKWAEKEVYDLKQAYTKRLLEIKESLKVTNPGEGE